MMNYLLDDKPLRLGKIIGRVFFLFTALTITSCAAVKPHERIYLNDDDMAQGFDQANIMSNNFQNYREGSSGANGGKSGGGCGCN